MYPTTFPRDQWYVAARSDEVVDSLLSRWLLGDPVVLYRRQNGTPVALVDRCVHRQMPLSMGRLEGDDLRCGYHGLLFDPDGRCREVPGTERVPARVRVQSYPLFERWGLIWIWMGDPDRRQESLIPDHRFLRSPGWTTASGTLHVRGRAQLMNENLLDLSHVPFLHEGSIGSQATAGVPASEVHSDDRSVRVTRRIADVECAPFFATTMEIDGRIDRVQIAEFFAPGFHITHTVVIPREGGEPRTNLTAHCITPESRTSTHYIWAVARDYRLDDAMLTDQITTGISAVFMQDVEATEAIERVIANYEPEHPVEINLPVDSGPLRSRRLIEAMAAAESDRPPARL